ncbi:MAG TPA: glycosyltransferase [Pyrinomonadaceae bacterium]|nr:glycosyltransferase [Pyrinomonadaceae bacterium]
MRILQVSSARAFGGGERHVVDLTRGLVARGHEVHIALAPESPLLDSLHHLSPQNVHPVALRNSFDLPGAVCLARLARRIGAEIVHAHVARDYPLAAYAAGRARSRLVVTRHVLFPLNRAHRLTLSNVSRVIAVSGAVARALQSRRIFPPDKIRVVLNGIDVSRFEAAREEFEHERACELNHVAPGDVRTPLRVGTVGTLVENKGHDTFLRAAALAASRGSSATEFLIVGDEGSRGGEYRRRLERLIAELNLGEHVRLHARWEETTRVLPTLDIFVSASRSEAFGLAMAEALACGVPVVATATDGALEIISDGTGGLIVPIDDHQALAAALVSLLEDDGLRAAFSARARESARRRFSHERMVVETEGVYLEALSDGR